MSDKYDFTVSGRIDAYLIFQILKLQESNQDFPRFSVLIRATDKWEPPQGVKINCQIGDIYTAICTYEALVEMDQDPKVICVESGTLTVSD